MKALVAATAVVALIGIAEGCGTAAGNLGVGAGVVTVLGGESPSQELEQVYYLGVFDPQEQVPEAVYRLTVRGQASIYSGMRFSSGWVPAKFVDSLNTQIGSSSDPTTRPVIDKGEAELLANLKPGRRLMLFGPEGFREAPPDHRLVIVMGSNPEAFFHAIDLTLGALAQAQVERLPAEDAKKIADAMAAAKQQEDQLNQLLNGINSYEFIEPKL